MEDSVTLCSNCQRQIAASNFVTHSVHCQRNLIKCEKCGEAVPRSSLEEHHAELHALVQCPNCNITLEQTLLDKHQKTMCKSRSLNCQYCELDFAASDMHEHEAYCGSRTKHCEECGEYVMLKYEQLHLDSNHKFLKLDDEPGPSAKWIKNDLESTSPMKIKSNNNTKRPQLSNGKFNNMESDDIDDIQQMLARLNKPKVWAPPRHGGVAYPLTGAPQRTISPPPFRRGSYSDDENEGDLVALPCEFCDAMVPSNQLLIHQTGCQVEVASRSKLNNSQVNFAPKETQASLSESSSFVDVVGVSDNESDIEVLPTNFEGKKRIKAEKEKDAYDDTELPCEFCGAGYPPSLLLDHQDACDFHPKNWSDVPVREERTLLSTSPKHTVFKDWNETPVREEHTLLSTAPKQSVFEDHNLFNNQHKDNIGFDQYDPSNAEFQVEGKSSQENEILMPLCSTSVGPHKRHVTPFSCYRTDNNVPPLPVSSHISSRSSSPLDKVPNSTNIPFSVLKNPCLCTCPQPSLPPLHHKKKKPFAGLDHESMPMSSLYVPRVNRFGNQTERVQTSKKELQKRPAETIPISSCNHAHHKVNFAHKATTFPPKKQETPCSSSLFARRDISKSPDRIPTSRLIPPNLSSFHQSRCSGVTCGTIPNPVSNSFMNGVSMTTNRDWNDLNLARPSSATGAIPKAKAGKLNIAWQVNQEVPRPRSSNNKVVTDHQVPDVAAGYSRSQPLPRKRNDKSPPYKKFHDNDGM